MTTVSLLKVSQKDAGLRVGVKRRLLVCGGRRGSPQIQELVTKTLNALVTKHYLARDFCMIQGGATGVDSIAKGWAINAGVAVLEMSANWTTYGDQAGAIRNRWMLEWAMPDLVVAFPGGTGTADMVKRAKRANVTCIEIEIG